MLFVPTLFGGEPIPSTPLIIRSVSADSDRPRRPSTCVVFPSRLAKNPTLTHGLAKEMTCVGRSRLPTTTV
jgi:hypothetical protein